MKTVLTMSLSNGRINKEYEIYFTIKPIANAVTENVVPG